CIIGRARPCINADDWAIAWLGVRADLDIRERATLRGMLGRHLDSRGKLQQDLEYRAREHGQLVWRALQRTEDEDHFALFECQIQGPPPELEFLLYLGRSLT